ncbi:VolA/Pla-1 family phospholipase [Idiomarina sp. PL1-037]|uniref:VolA/Pla-1 family phospholipase n=1 Tax=Idiomarina sp. PL1-037 TaxID=3095365 RepID=UPI002ACC041E|nr:VolA/Pla-1 family phospholipase [Idiomarina sp. PL1-037]WQC53853.1 VolA/Pla-1 family phospholipase [Idiomarina sp. PL1-037]
MKKLLLPLAIGSALSLVGCGSGDEAPLTEKEVSVAASRVVFDPSNGEIPIPTNILLGENDGTLELPIGDPNSAQAATRIALNGLDGWGTHSPLSFELSLPVDQNGEQVSLNPASVEAQGAVRVFKTVQGGQVDVESCVSTNPVVGALHEAQLAAGESSTIASSPAAVCSISEELTHGEDFQVQATGAGSFVVIPTQPFEPETGYLVALTDNIQDSLGRRVKASQTYTLMKRSVAEYPASDEDDARNLQSLINVYEAALTVGANVDAEDVIYSSNFTTQSVGTALGAVKSLYAQRVPAGAVPALGLGPHPDGAATVGDLLDPEKYSQDAIQVASAANVYVGKVELPYYSPVPTAENPTAPLTGRWTAKCDSAAAILNAVADGEVNPAEAGITAEMLANPELLVMENEGGCFNLSDSDDQPIDPERHVTKYSPIPEKQSDEEVTVFATTPNVAVANMIRPSFGLEPLSAPADGWPVVIFQHGITADKNSAAAIAGTLAVAGYAMVAIDHPLHGDRAFGEINASSEAGAINYMNLQSLLTTRDNVRQSISDLIGLRLSLSNASFPDSSTINAQDVHFVGHSLGAIAGTGFTTIANAPFSKSQLEPLAPMFKVQASALGMPGGSLANFLLASEEFGPVIKGNIAYNASEAFAESVDTQAEAAGIEKNTAAYLELLAAAYAEFEANGDPEAVAELQASLNQFAFAAQTVVDSADPINYAKSLRALGTPLLAIEAVGDSVIPNNVPPLGGTEPLAALLDLEGISTTTTSEDGTPVRGIVRFGGDAEHGSLVDVGPSAAVTAEMQQQIAFWFAADMLQLPVTNEEVVE